MGETARWQRVAAAGTYKNQQEEDRGMIERVRDVGRKGAAVAMAGMTAGALAFGAALDDDVAQTVADAVDAADFPYMDRFLAAEEAAVTEPVDASDRLDRTRDAASQTIDQMAAESQGSADAEHDVMGC